VVLDDLGENGVYVGMDVGVYYRKNGMAVWDNFSDQLPNVSVRELEIAGKGSNPGDKRLIAATFGRGVWRSTLWGTTQLRLGASLPRLQRFTASRNGSILTLRFQLGTDRYQGGYSRIQLATLDGKVVYQDQVPNFGVSQRSIDLSGRGQGVYLFVLKKGDQYLSRRIAIP
jgi:hypothetical protein